MANESADPTSNQEASVEEPNMAAEATSPEIIIEEPTSAETIEAEPATLEDQIEALEAQVKEEQDKALRAQAEMINFRKRQDKDRSSWSQMATKDIISSFLEPLDNLERTVEAATKSEETETDERTKSLAEGVTMVIKQIHDVLTRKNVETVDPKGELFDPNLHEAYGQIETDEVEEGHVATVFRKGYRIGDNLIRTATVQIAKKPAE
jgi:molecular chaperone GrpE